MTSIIENEQVVSPTTSTNIHSTCTISCSFDCTAGSDFDACSDGHCHDESREHAPATTNMPLVVGPALVSPTAVANGCKSCYTRPPHLRAKCCGPGKAKLFKKKSKILGAVLAESGILSELLEKEEQEKKTSSLSKTGSYIHLTQFTSAVGEDNNCTKELTSTTKETLEETLIEQANHNNLPPMVDVSTHQEAIEKPSRMRSFLSGLLQRKQKVPVNIGFSGSASVESSNTSHIESSLATTTEN